MFYNDLMVFVHTLKMFILLALVFLYMERFQKTYRVGVLVSRGERKVRECLKILNMDQLGAAPSSLFG